MHHIYHTEGIILGSRNYGEAGKYYDILTRDLGLVRASASGVRKIDSRLRYVLQDFSHIKVDLVRGKDFWRVTTASKTGILDDLTKKREVSVILFSVAKLLKRLLPGEEANEKLFKDFLDGLVALRECENKEILGNMEILIVLRVLSNLGYIGMNEELKYLVESPFLGELSLEVSKNKSKLLSQINRAIRATHL